MESRLRQNELQRQEKVSAIRGSGGDEQEMIRGYWSQFNDARKQMAVALQSAAPSDLDAADAILNDAVEQCRGLQLKLSQAASYLPPFDIRQSFDAIASLLKDINAVRASLLPKPAFGFKSRRSPAVSVFDVSASDIAGVEVVADVATDSAHGACVVKDVTGSSVIMTRADLQRHSGSRDSFPCRPSIPPFSLLVVRRRCADALARLHCASAGELLALTSTPRRKCFAEPKTTAAASNCTLPTLAHPCPPLLQGPTTAIRMFDLARCTVIAAPVVGGSIFIEACDGCTSQPSFSVFL